MYLTLYLPFIMGHTKSIDMPFENVKLSSNDEDS